MFLCSECDPCGGSFRDGGDCFGLESRGTCEACDKVKLCTDCHAGKPVQYAGKHRKEGK